MYDAIEPPQTDFSRAQCYALFAAAWRYPDEEQLTLIREGVLVDDLKEVLAVCAPELIDDTSWQVLANGGEEDALAIEYTRLFDLSTSKNGCSLHSGNYVSARMKHMEELVRFYNHFGLSMKERDREMPDHITSELEFMHYLSYCETQVLAEEKSAADLQRAQRDFIGRGLELWLSQLQEKLLARQAMDFYVTLSQLLIGFLLAESHRLLTLVGKAGPADSSKIMPFVEINH